MKAFLLLFLFAFSKPAFASDIEDGVAAFNNGEYAKAFEILTPYAESGNPTAFKYIGLMYWIGKGTPMKRPRACDYFEQASLQHEEETLSMLGLCYFAGFGRERNMNKAYDLLKKDYKLGNQNFLFFLVMTAHLKEDYPLAVETAIILYARGENSLTNYIGTMYRDGKGVEQNFKAGCDWFEKSAKSGDSKGMHLYGNCFSLGEGRPKDKKAAYTYFKKAAELGHEKAIALEKEIRKELYGE